SAKWRERSAFSLLLERALMLVQNIHNQNEPYDGFYAPSRNRRTRSAISSRVARNTRIRSSCEPSAVAGSSIGQCSRIEGPGKMGQLSRARSQTVMT